MHTSLIKIGNSQGIRLPKAIIEQAGLEQDLDLQVVDGAVVIRAAGRVRSGWTEAAATCHAAGEDAMDEWDATVGDRVKPPGS